MTRKLPREYPLGSVYRVSDAHTSAANEIRRGEREEAIRHIDRARDALDAYATVNERELARLESIEKQLVEENDRLRKERDEAIGMI